MTNNQTRRHYQGSQASQGKALTYILSLRINVTSLRSPCLLSPQSLPLPTGLLTPPQSWGLQGQDFALFILNQEDPGSQTMLCKLAELNSYPFPSHLLKTAKAHLQTGDIFGSLTTSWSASVCVGRPAMVSHVQFLDSGQLVPTACTDPS